jgi:hypothetical protein
VAWKLATGVTKTIAPGATSIEFYAWGSGTVSFGGAGQTGPQNVVLTATPVQYSIPITTTYVGATNVFTISFDNAAHPGTVVINVDDIRWL